MYQVDAFAQKVFQGNPAAVCILDRWPDEATMQKIGNENNLSETAFAVSAGDCYEIRWFTPEMEVNLCGHATLATAHVLFNHLNIPGEEICFNSLFSGRLNVKRSGDLLTLDFPADQLEEMVVPELIVTALMTPPLKADVDFVSRFFAPQTGISEDPVTGSAHTTLTPYWSRVLGKKKLSARQLSSRGGELLCEDKGDRVEISGHAVTYMKGEIQF